METPYEITTLTRPDPPQHFTAPAVRPPLAPEEIPPGVEMVTLPSGIRTLAYTQPPTPHTTLAPAPAQGVPRWAKTTALLAPTLGIGLGAAGAGLSYAAPGILAMTHALWAAVAFIAVTGTTAALLLARCRRPAPITQHITAHGLFSRATGTINQ